MVVCDGTATRQSGNYRDFLSDRLFQQDNREEYLSNLVNSLFKLKCASRLRLCATQEREDKASSSHKSTVNEWCEILICHL